MKRPYLNPEISVYKIASENVALDISDVLNYSSSRFNGSSADNSFAVEIVSGNNFQD